MKMNIIENEVGTLAVDGWAVTFGTAMKGLGGRRSPPSLLLAVPNLTAHPSTASVPITVLLSPLLFNVSIKGLRRRRLIYPFNFVESFRY